MATNSRGAADVSPRIGQGLILGLAAAHAASALQLTGFDRNGVLTWTNAPVPGVCSVEVADTLSGPWRPTQNAFATNPVGTLTVPTGIGNRFHRLRAVDVPATFQGFTNLVESYGILETLAGFGGGQDEENHWYPWFEGGPAPFAALSRPHFAMADRTGSVYIAGNGTAFGGGDGASALAAGLYGVRSIWPVPTGGYLLLTHDGCQLWYLDTAGIVHLLLNGARGDTHGGDGLFFYSPEPKISEGRSVTMDYAGNILICESDYGYLRRIRFQRMNPGTR